jgi:hypothetical protein
MIYRNYTTNPMIDVLRRWQGCTRPSLLKHMNNHIHCISRVLCFAFALVCLAGCEKKGTPARFLIPADYEGPVITVFGQPGFPALPTKDGFQIHNYPEDGILITSSAREIPQASDETLEVLKDGSLRRINSGDGAGRRERYSEFGSLEAGGHPQFDYIYKIISSVHYTGDGNAVRERDRKHADAVRKLNLKPLQKSTSEPGGAGQPAGSPESNSESSDKLIPGSEGRRFKCEACGTIYTKCSSCGLGPDEHSQVNHVSVHDGCNGHGYPIEDTVPSANAEAVPPKTGDQHHFGREGYLKKEPVELIAFLIREHERGVIVVHLNDAPRNWIKKEHIGPLVLLLDSIEPCASVYPLRSSAIPPKDRFKPSTVGHEAAYLIDSYRSAGLYPGSNLDTSTDLKFDRDEIKRWWAGFQNQ